MEQMGQMDRRDFVKLAGAGTAAAAAFAGVPLAAQLVKKTGDVLTFRASGGLPDSTSKLPSYATQIVEGTVDLSTGTGLVTSRVLAGHPGDPSMVGLPGTGRVMRITSATREGSVYKLQGLVEDRSQLVRGESHRVEIVVDPRRKVVHAPFAGRQKSLTLSS
jgi:hypothetical protein